MKYIIRETCTDEWEVDYETPCGQIHYGVMAIIQPRAKNPTISMTNGHGMFGMKGMEHIINEVKRLTGKS